MVPAHLIVKVERRSGLSIAGNLRKTITNQTKWIFWMLRCGLAYPSF